MKKTHFDWQVRVLADIKFLIVQAMGKTELFDNREDAEKKLKSLPNYTHSELYEKVDFSNQEEFKDAVILHDLNNVVMHGSIFECLASVYQPTLSLTAKTLFGKVSKI